MAERRRARRVLRAAAWSVGVVLVVLVLVAVAPFGLRERSVRGSVADTAAALPGEAQLVSDGLRGLGYSCSDVATSADGVTRSCSRVRYLTASRVQLVVQRDTGAVQLAVATTDDERPSQARTTYREALDVLSRSLDLPNEQQAQVRAAAVGTQDAALTFDWGSVTVRPVLPVPAAESSVTLRAADSPNAQPAASLATLDVPVDAFASAARAHGYTCATPQVQTIRGCDKADGDYAEELWFQGTDRYTTEVYLSVRSNYHTQTRERWIQTMDQTMSWVDTGQTRAVRTWLAASADAPGADSYVDGLPISFLVRTDEWTKETFGHIRAECAGSTDDISGCDDRARSTSRPG